MGIPKEELHRLVDRLPEHNLARAKKYLEMLLTISPPDSAAKPRPQNKPFYISPNCPECGTPLVPADVLNGPDTPEDQIWHDEFICPKCLDFIYLDWPESERTALNEGKCQEGGIEWDELKRELDL
ncbi:MAG: hypothetical protein HPY89_07125 [Pelotomaculum sp.]|uniref:Uncharacterized protein n=1 Tax=Pelotomaculum thermopropionicum (strain DSM 13744 / JCM 10971 / SI) TaxID=370438 RepID=A5D572_PELTS|nr:hypothetical protein [Pelotomaculum sp.]BAF58599.1 hypothetical protein PTH_0418 [Pelotomaculum thermopropionicum SI]